jgi:hypothetical protein
MITYVLSQFHRLLREAPVDAPRVTLDRTHFLVHVHGTLHRVRRDLVCDCGGTPQSLCPALPLVRDYLASGGSRPLGRHESSWPEVWAAAPAICPICDSPTVADRYLDSARGPGWCCAVDPLHFWQVRLRPLRRCLAARLPQYPWYDQTTAEQHAWLEAHTHLPRCVPNPNRPEVIP